MLYTYWINAWKNFWGTHREEKRGKAKWAIDFYETYQTTIESNKADKEEAVSECFKLFNIHAVKPVRIRLNTSTRSLEQ